jgi:hypothetical protein
MSMQHFTDHIREAIKLNVEHWNSYQVKMKASGHVSEVKILNGIFSSLIRSERLTMLFSWFYDWKCPIAMSYSFVPIQPIPEPTSTIDQFFLDINPRSYLPEFKSSLHTKNIPQIEKLLTANLLKLKNPRHNCMLRHLMESMHRCLWVYQNIELSKKEKSVYWHYVKGHALFFASANDLDRKAFAIQKLGIPVLATELPPIPYSPK